mgnify:CR=1 FL=1
MMKHVLSIAGTDPSGGAGQLLTARLFVPMAVLLECHYGRCVAEYPGRSRVYGRHAGTDCIADRCVFEDIDVDAVKIGMVSVPKRFGSLPTN